MHVYVCVVCSMYVCGVCVHMIGYVCGFRCIFGAKIVSRHFPSLLSIYCGSLPLNLEPTNPALLATKLAMVSRCYCLIRSHPQGSWGSNSGPQINAFSTKSSLCLTPFFENSPL